jgi:tetratricopeptide (TPR) repeat protein
MDLEERISYLENVRDWQSLVDELEKGIASPAASAVKAQFHLKLGRVLETKFLSGVRALKHFQDAYKLNPLLLDSLDAARQVYWDLGKLNMVQKLLELELKAKVDAPRASALLVELGDVVGDQGDFDKATATYARALALSGGNNAEASACLEDLQLRPNTWQARVSLLLGNASAATDAATKGRLLLRAARITRRFAPAEAEGVLARAYLADPTNKEVSLLYESLLSEHGRLEVLEQAQQQILRQTEDRGQRGRLALIFGTRWAVRHQNAVVGPRFLEEALKLDPDSEGAFFFLREAYGKKDGDWDRVLTLAEETATRAEDGHATFLLAQAGTIAWRQLGNLIRARLSFERLSAVSPEHPQLRAFEAQIGETLKPVVAPRSAERDGQDGSAAAPAPVSSADPTPRAPTVIPAEAEGSRAPAFQEESRPGRAVAQAVSPAVVQEESRPGRAVAQAVSPAVVQEESRPVPAIADAGRPRGAVAEPVLTGIAPRADARSSDDEPAESRPAHEVPSPLEPAGEPISPPVASVDLAKIAELQKLAEKQESSKRYSEFVKTLLQLALLVPDRRDKVALYAKAADLYVSKFANQAEAVKAYEAVLAIDPDNTQAVEYLRQMYEKRRDWEKLLGLQRREADRLPAGPNRAAKFLEIARLATERVKKPDVCIDLWQEVLASDETNAEALGALAGLYERAKDFEKLAAVLERQADVTLDAPAKIQVLTKLGTIYGERLNDDDGAVGAWRSLLALDPSDRRAQDALKKKYLTLGRWDDLEVFYADTGKWDEFIRVLEQQETKEADPRAKVSLLFKIAELWADKKQKLDRAAKSYEKVLDLDPDNLRAAQALIPIYAAANNPRALANAIEVKLRHEQDPMTKLGLLREVGALYEGKVKDPQRAFHRYLAAFELFPGDDQTSEDVERVAKAVGQWDPVVSSYRKAIALADEGGDPIGAVMLRLRLGRVLVDDVNQIGEALDVYRAVYEAQGENAEAIAALERLYRQTSRFAELLGIFEKQRDLSTTPEEKKAIHYEIAKLYEEEIQDVDKAIDTYVQVLEDEPADAQALASLDVLYGRLGRWEPYVEVLRRRIDLDLVEAELVDLKFRLGQTLERHLADPLGALENYREILFVDAGHEGARVALEEMLAGPLRTEAASILESIYEEREDWPKLIAVLEILGAGETQVDRRVALKRKAARIGAERTNDSEHAFVVLASALRDDPALAETRDEIESIAAASGAERQLVALYTELASSLEDAALARDYWLRIAGIHDRLGDVDRAAKAYGRVLLLDPADAEALAFLEQLFTRTRRWKDLIGVVERRIQQTTDAKDREALYGTMAGIYEERLERPEDAVSAYRKVLELDPTSDRALRALDALFTRQAMWSDLAENLEAQLALAATDEEQLSLMLRLADLREAQMGLVDVAIEGYRAVLERAPTNDRALAALERLGADPKYELTIADLLEPLYRHTGDWQKLIGTHEVQVRRSEDATRRVELLHQIAQLYEDAAGDLGSAFATLARALREDPSHDATQQQLDRLARATGRFGDVARVFEDLAAQIGEPMLASALTMKAASIHESDLGNIDRAIALYRNVLEIDPLSLPAAEALERLFRSTERHQELSVILQRKSEILEEPADKKDALFQAAAIEEDVLNRPESAIAVYSRVLEIDSDDLRAIDALIRRYLDLSRWSDLLIVYARKADLVADVDEKKGIYYQVGAVYERELGNVPKAIDTYTKILELDPDDLQALSRLDVLYEQAGNWQELLSVLMHESDMTADPNEAVSFQYRIAELYEKHLEDVARSVELYRDLLVRQPDHEPTLAALEGLKEGEREPLGAAAVLEPIYETTSDWPKLIRVLEVQIRHATDPFQKVELLHRVARLHEDALGDHGAAFETYARALAVDDGNEGTLGSLERLAIVVHRWPQVARLYDAELDSLARAERTERFVELGLRNAQIFELQLDDADGAIARYRRVVDVDPENLTAIKALDRLFLQSERWADLAAVLVREAEIGQSADDVLEVEYRLGRVLQTKLGDVEGALAAYREVIGASPDHQPTVEALEGLFAEGVRQADVGEILEPLYRATGEWEKLSRVHEAQLAGTVGQKDRLAAYYRLAELFEDKLLDPAKTLEVTIRLLKEVPLDDKAGEEAQRLAARVDAGWETLANAYADILAVHTEPEVQKSIGRRLARTFEDELGDVGKAEETYKYVLGVDPADADALANLDRIYVSIEGWKDLAQILEMRVQATTDNLELVELFARLGELYEQRLGDVPSAIRAYRHIFDGLDRAHDGAIAALARIYEQQAAWQELDAVYRGELENAAGGSGEADIRAKMGRLAAERLGQPERAIDSWKIVLDLRGEDPEALHALSDLYESLAQWAKLVDVLEREFDIASSDEVRVAVLTRRAKTLSDKLGRDDSARQDWIRVLDIDYSNLEALRSIANICRRQGDANELVGALHQLVDRAAGSLDAEELKETFRELGKTYGDSLQQPYDAADAWRKLLDVGPDFEAMDSLEAIYRREERWTDVIDVKMRRADALGEPSEQIDELRKVAALWREQVGDADGARVADEKILVIDPRHDDAFAELEKLHSSAGRWEPLVELYLGRLETQEETGAKTQILRKIARVFEEKLDDKNQALEALVNALSLDFHDRETARYLERMAQATGRWSEIIQTVNGWLKQQTEPQDKIRLCLHLAKWYGDDLGHPEYAQPYYAQIIQLDPQNVGATRQLASLYKKAGNWQQMGATLTRALDVASNDLDRKEILTDLGEVLDAHMQQTEQAVTYFQRALEVDPQFLPALENLERIYGSRAQNRELVDVLQRKVLALKEPEEIAATKLRMAQIFESSLNDAARAAQVYREVVDIAPGHLQALRGLARVYQALERWADLVGVLEKQLDVVTTERERIDVLMNLATLHEEHFLKADLAAQRLEQALEVDPSNEAAYFKLERAYRRLRQWKELVETYERHIGATHERKTKVELFGAIAQVYADEIEDAERAIDAYKNIVALDEHNIAALEALAKLYDKTGDATQSIDCMTQVAELTQDTKQRVEAFYRIGKALDEKLGDRVLAQDRFETALDLDSSHLPTLAALRQIAIDSADFDKAARYLAQEQGFTQSPRQRARLLVDLGRLREEMLGDHSGAVAAWESAYEADSENEDAAMPLVDEYIAGEQWAKAEPLLELLVRKSGKRERSEQHALQNKLGRVCAALGKDDKALKAFTAAHQLDLTDQVTIRGLAEVSFKLKDWTAALANYQKVLTALGEGESAARAEVYYKLGCIKGEQGQARQAINNFEKALSVDPAHRPTLEALVSLYAEAKDWKQVVAYKRQILDNVYDVEDRFRMLNEIADVWSEQDKSVSRAIEALEEARELQPFNPGLLHKLIALYQSTENWSKMIDTLSAIADNEKDALRKSKFLYTMAQLYRDKEGDQDKAVELFGEALDLNPQYLEAFERINKILTAKKDWKALERAFRKMLRRMSAGNVSNPDLEFALWHNLGLIYRDRLRDTASGIEAFKMATRVKPDEAVERQILAELYEATDQIEAAIGEHSLVLQNEPLRVEPYRSLYKLYLRMHEYDRAWCMCAALAFLHKADEEEQRFFEDYRPRGMIQVKSRLDNEAWVRFLFHKDENLYIGKIFEMLTPAAIIAKTNQLKAQKQLPVLDRRFRQDPATSTVTFAKTFGWAGQVLGIATPELYVRNDVPGALLAVVSTPPASVAGQTVLTGFTPQELTFIVGKHLSNYRGEHYIKNLFPTLNELKVILFAGVKIVIPDFAVPGEMAQAVNATAAELVKHMQPVQRESLRLVVQKWIEDGAKADLRRWMQAIEITACRAGLLLCADLEIAKKIIAAEPQLPGDLPPVDKMKELLVFSVSEQYFSLRKTLGIAVG